MANAIVDTDVVSFNFKEDTRGDLYEPHLSGVDAFISFMTLAELEQWTLTHNWSVDRRNRLRAFIKQRFTAVQSSLRLCRKWAEIREQVRRDGRIIQTADAWIAATALLYDIPLITHNIEDFTGIAGLTVISEAAE